MSFEGERQAFETRLAANFSATPIQFENVPFSPPRDAAWISLMILSGEGRQASLGPGALNRFLGVAEIHIYVPEDQGTKVARQHADTLEAIFREQQFSASGSGKITVRTPWYQTRGVEEGWHHSLLMIPYQRDKI